MDAETLKIILELKEENALMKRMLHDISSMPMSTNRRDLPFLYFSKNEEINKLYKDAASFTYRLIERVIQNTDAQANQERIQQ